MKKIISDNRKNLLLREEQVFDYGCVMLKPSSEFCKKIIEFNTKLIPDSILFKENDKYGREFDVHVTVKYGLTNSYSFDQMKKMLSSTKPFRINLVSLDIFQNDKFDVVKFNVESKELRKLNKFFSSLPNEDEYPTYNPHSTLAYVLPGKGLPYKNKPIDKNISFEVKTVIYSDNGDQLFINL